VVFGANFNKFGVVNDLNDLATRKVPVCIVFRTTSTSLAFMDKLNDPEWLAWF
jgi:hypothetical protein